MSYYKEVMMYRIVISEIFKLTISKVFKRFIIVTIIIGVGFVGTGFGLEEEEADVVVGLLFTGAFVVTLGAGVGISAFTFSICLAPYCSYQV
jgi:hypothetical protein